MHERFAARLILQQFRKGLGRIGVMNAAPRRFQNRAVLDEFALIQTMDLDPGLKRMIRKARAILAPGQPILG